MQELRLTNSLDPLEIPAAPVCIYLQDKYLK